MGFFLIRCTAHACFPELRGSSFLVFTLLGSNYNLPGMQFIL